MDGGAGGGEGGYAQEAVVIFVLLWGVRGGFLFLILRFLFGGKSCFEECG